jgi:hypothetical protein
MLAHQSLRRPSSWQDFETLCKKLWQEIWNCPGIKKNGRQGQEQYGVDIYGVPQSETEYFGIQCKGKSEYNDDQYHHPQFTSEEIDIEIEKSKTFTPALKSLIFATTALKDSKIEAYVRQKDIEHRKLGLFEIHLFSWEDIVDLIDENRQTHDWYVLNQKYRQNCSAQVSFNDGAREASVIARYRRTDTRYVQKMLPKQGEYTANALGVIGLSKYLIPYKENHFGLGIMDKIKVNHSYVPIQFKIHNSGSESIEDYKLSFKIAGQIQDIKRNNKSYPAISPGAYQTHSPTVTLSKQDQSGKIVPYSRNLVSQDEYITEPFYIKPVLEPSTLTVTWQLLAKNYRSEGELKVRTKSDVKAETFEELTEDYLLVRRGTLKGDLVDLIEYITS